MTGNETVTLNFRQLAFLKQKLVNLNADVERVNAETPERLAKDLQQIQDSIHRLIGNIHMLAGCESLWLKDFEDENRLRRSEVIA
jgi:hypothetical protein